MSNRKLQITIIGNSHAAEATYEIAYKAGKLVAKLNAVLITGGRGGVMEAAAKGAAEEGGIAVGILPSADFNESNQYNYIVIPTGMGHARNALTVLAADAVIAIGGGAGTLSEIALAWVAHKPVIAYAGAEGWAKELINKSLDGSAHQKILSFDNMEELEALLRKII